MRHNVPAAQRSGRAADSSRRTRRVGTGALLASMLGGGIVQPTLAFGPPEPAAEWDFEGTGSTLLDTGVVGSPLDMASVGGLSRSVETPVSGLGLVFGGRSLVFTDFPTYSYVSPGANTKLESSTVTMEAWFKPATLGGSGQLLLTYYPRGAANNGRGYALSISPDGRVACSWGNGTGLFVTAIAPSANAIVAGTWSHLAASFEPGTIRLFVNGVQVSHLATTGSIVFSDFIGLGPNPKTMYLGTGHNANDTPPTHVPDLYGAYAVHAGSLLDRVRVHRIAMRGVSEDGSVASQLDFWSCAPIVRSQPVSFLTCPAMAVNTGVTVTGTGPFTYQWQIEDAGAPGTWLNIIDGINSPSGWQFSASGALTSTLQTNAFLPSSHVAQLRCVISNACGSVTSDAASLTVCVADYDCNTFVNGDDFDQFVYDFVYGLPAADVNHDTFVSGEDFDYFVDHFVAGC